MTERYTAYTLVDSSFYPFGSRSISMDGDRHGETPRSFKWSVHRQPGTIFYTDIRLSEVKHYSNTLEIALLIEPSWKPSPYETAQRLSNAFDYILSYRDNYFNTVNHLWYPFGGSWIKDEDWGIKEKSKQLSIIGTQKLAAPGHKLRHTAIRLYGDRLDVYGRGYNPIPSKIPALAPYRYSVVIEPQRLDSYFTEKLIDCFSQGTIPLYWGTRKITNFFDERGMIILDNITDIYNHLPELTPSYYNACLPYIRANLEAARAYQCAEDWIYSHHPHLFT